jgi:hypothetical protein
LQVAPAEPSEAAKRKRGARRSDDGLPLSSFRGLIDHLATMTLNLVASAHARKLASERTRIGVGEKTSRNGVR